MVKKDLRQKKEWQKLLRQKHSSYFVRSWRIQNFSKKKKRKRTGQTGYVFFHNLKEWSKTEVHA